MSRYQLPLDLLGGGEIDAREEWGGCAGGRPEYHLPGGFTLLAPPGKPLDEIVTVPPEPVNGSVVRITSLIRPKLRIIAERDDSAEGAVSDERWFTTEAGPATWVDLVGPDGVVTYLVPDPFAEPVTLPWDAETSYGAEVGVRALDTGSVNEWIQRPDVKSVVATLTPTLARDKARALWAAADAAEAQP
jgi:hypothetical protein